MTMGITLVEVTNQEFSDSDVYLISVNGDELEFSNGHIYRRDAISNTYYLVRK